ncbi:hypothetical protein PAXRUDRAFT_12955 [Paxillus rubicundulus Ve08.2h10]|uniref:Uncharacterized protein n=1 Tax=Paxillus rubicundulus Ve08.2h10 TaxID=930991 RepID=A0A0D0DUS3_9AGAM|nr:hypothetical protein PAXRUDRAFT_12955 [Paxillus rubicundulus Ve08.2h10]
MPYPSASGSGIIQSQHSTGLVPEGSNHSTGWVLQESEYPSGLSLQESHHSTGWVPEESHHSTGWVPEESHYPSGLPPQESYGWVKREGSSEWIFYPPPSNTPEATLQGTLVPVPYTGEYFHLHTHSHLNFHDLTASPHWPLFLGNRLYEDTPPLTNLSLPDIPKGYGGKTIFNRWPGGKKLGESVTRQAETQLAFRLLKNGIDVPRSEFVAHAQSVLEATALHSKKPTEVATFQSSEEFATSVFSGLMSCVGIIFRDVTIDLGVAEQTDPKKAPVVLPGCVAIINQMVANPYKWCHRTFVSPQQTVLLVKFVDLRIDMYFTKLLMAFPELTVIWLANWNLTDINSFTPPIKLIARVIFFLQWGIEIATDGPKRQLVQRSRALNKENSLTQCIVDDMLNDTQLQNEVEEAYYDPRFFEMNQARWYNIMKQIRNARCPVD